MPSTAADLAEPRVEQPAPARRLLRSVMLFAAATAALTIAALVIRLYGIDRESLWLDEGYTLLFSHLPLPQLFLVGGAHEHPPLYYLIDHLLYRLRDSYLIPRYVSAVAGALSVPALVVLGVRLFGRVAGLTAGFLLLVSPFQIWYGQDGRAYALAGLMVLASYLCLVSALATPRLWLWVAYSIATALALYSEYTTILVLVPQALWLIPARERGCHRQLLGSWTASALLFLPWIGTVVLDAASIAGHYWIPPPSPSDFANTILEFLGLRVPCPAPPCVPPQAAVPVLAGHEIWLSGIATVLALGVLLWAIASRKLEYQIVTLWLVVPFIIVLALIPLQSLYLDRVFLDATFALFLLLGAGVAALWSRRPRRYLAALPALLVAAGSLLSVGNVYSFTTNPDWKSVAADLRTVYQPGQAAIFIPAVLRPIVTAYLPGGWHASTEVSLWYSTYLDVPGWTDRYGSLSDDQLRNLQLAEAAGSGRPVWLITEDYSGINDSRRWFVNHGYQPLLSEIYLDDTRIELWGRKPPQAFGPPALPTSSDFAGWTQSGKVDVAGAVATETGRSSMTHSFSVVPGRAYSVGVEYLATPPAAPAVAVRVFDRREHQVGVLTDRFGRRLDTFPRTEWYNLPATGAWLQQPFGFIAPPGAARAVIRLQNAWGQVSWRDVGVYRQP